MNKWVAALVFVWLGVLVLMMAGYAIGGESTSSWSQGWPLLLVGLAIVAGGVAFLVGAVRERRRRARERALD